MWILKDVFISLFLLAFGYQKASSTDIYEDKFYMPTKNCKASVREYRLPPGKPMHNIEGTFVGHLTIEDCIELCHMLRYCTGVVYDKDKHTCQGYNKTTEEYNHSNATSTSHVFLAYFIRCFPTETTLLQEVKTALRLNCTEQYQQKVLQINFDLDYLDNIGIDYKQKNEDNQVLFFTKKTMHKTDARMSTMMFHGQCKMNCWMHAQQMGSDTMNNVLYLNNTCYCMDSEPQQLAEAVETLGKFKKEGRLHKGTAVAIGRGVECTLVDATEYLTGLQTEEALANSKKPGIQFQIHKKEQIQL